MVFVPDHWKLSKVKWWKRVKEVYRQNLLTEEHWWEVPCRSTLDELSEVIGDIACTWHVHTVSPVETLCRSGVSWTRTNEIWVVNHEGNPLDEPIVRLGVISETRCLKRMRQRDWQVGDHLTRTGSIEGEGRPRRETLDIHYLTRAIKYTKQLNEEDTESTDCVVWVEERGSPERISYR